MSGVACAVGIRMHSGWGTFVAVCGPTAETAVVDRRRVITMDPKMPGGRQPYHHAAQAKLAEPQSYLATCARASQVLAVRALEQLMRDLDRRQYQLTGAALLLASGRTLPSLTNILASHSLIHMAEGEFFRRAVADACHHLAIPVIGYRERELDQGAQLAFGRSAGQVYVSIAKLGKSLGPPWTKDEKTATMAAALLLSGYSNLGALC